MTSRATGACLLAILTVVGACAPVSPTPLATRTPKPTFTISSGAATFAPMSTATNRAISQAQPSAPPSSEVPGAGTPTPLPTVTSAAGQTVAATTAPSATATATVTRTPTATTTPSTTPTSTQTPSPTPEPTATPLPCPAGYALHIHDSPGFSVCHPEGWLVSVYEDAEHSARGVSFDAPGSNRVTGAELQFFTVQEAPNTTGLQGQDYIEATATSLINRYMEVLVGWPYTLTVDGQAGLEIAYEAGLPYEDALVAVLGWKTVVLVGGQEWTVEVVGRGEYREAVQALHTSVVESLQFLALHGGE